MKKFYEMDEVSKKNTTFEIFRSINSILNISKTSSSRFNERELDTSNLKILSFLNEDILRKLFKIVRNLTLTNYDLNVINYYTEFLELLFNFANTTNNLQIFSTSSSNDLVYSFDNILKAINNTNQNINLFNQKFLLAFQKIHFYLGVGLQLGLGIHYSMSFYELYAIRINPNLIMQNFTFNFTKGNEDPIRYYSNNLYSSNTSTNETSHSDIFIPIKLLNSLNENSKEIIMTIQNYKLNIYVGNSTVDLLLNSSYNITMKFIENDFQLSEVNLSNISTAINASIWYKDLDSDLIDSSICTIYQNDFNFSACITYVGYSSRTIFRCDCKTFGQVVVITNDTLDLNLSAPIYHFPKYDAPFYNNWGIVSYLFSIIVLIISIIAGFCIDKVTLGAYYINLKEKKEYFHYREKLKNDMFDLKTITFRDLFWDMLKYTHEILSIIFFSDLYYLRIHRTLLLFIKIYVMILFNLIQTQLKNSVDEIKNVIQPRAVPEDSSNSKITFEHVYDSFYNVK